MIQRSVGEKLEEGAIIAGQRGVGARQLRAPANGTITAVSEGQVLLQVADERSVLPARVPGVIIEVEPNRGVTIECVGAWVQGVWGNGRLAEGILNMSTESADQVLTADRVDMSLRGAILVAGRCEQRQTLELAAQVPIRGLVLGSLSIRLVPLAEKMPYPIVLIEGFGPIPMNSDAFKLFSNLAGEQAALNAQRPDPLNGDRPEVIIPAKEAGRPPQPVGMQSFRIGQTVRILSGPERGTLGEIAALPSGAVAFPSGLRVQAAQITLEHGGHADIPLANLELLG